MKIINEIFCSIVKKYDLQVFFFLETNLLVLGFRPFKLIPFMHFSANLGRKLLGKKHVIPNLADRKWQGVLPLNFRFRWKSV
jgi:hypothetical protein